ncbi:hypothetical protein TRFO_23405 [Tritrichomonas foetus]|uniref:Uncharacterized protein n=1 Tax=Tritrichomonas foetus TaxID=1144522 RepID=A0A1J4K9P0_9EUKA|nr:hypothetical protein TRFO_23405 [Tritrichomonas foetus]|eukprot:OHT08185.1 hypothetical protein TRFO_23405 [Tritrichomonas foetus]
MMSDSEITEEEEIIYEPEEEEDESDSGAVELFLAELRKYRKSQSKKKPPKIKKSPKIVLSKKKRKKHKLFDPNPPKKEEKVQIDNSPIKIISQKDYNAMIERLTEKKESVKSENSPNSKKKEKKANNGNSNIFNDLYDQSVQAKEKLEQLKKKQDKEEEEEIKKWVKPKTCRASKVHAHNRVIKYVNEAFGEINECSEEELVSIFEKLGLFEANKRFDDKHDERLKSIPELACRLEHCVIRNDGNNKPIYRTSEFHKIYLQVAQGQLLTPFHHLAKEKLLIAMANEKKPAVLDFDPLQQFTTAKECSKDTLARLCVPRKTMEITPQEAEERVELNILSETSKKILMESKNEISSLPIDQREKRLMQRKEDKIDKMKKEFYQQITQREVKINPIPEYDKETTNMLAEYREKKKNYKEPEPSYRPTVTKYDEFLKQQELINSVDFKPTGWEEDIERHRKGYAKFIHMKRIKEEGLEYLLKYRREERQKTLSSPIKENEKNSKNKANTLPSKVNQMINVNEENYKDNRVNKEIQTNKSKPSNEKATKTKNYEIDPAFQDEEASESEVSDLSEEEHFDYH